MSSRFSSKKFCCLLSSQCLLAVLFSQQMLLNISLYHIDIFLSTPYSSKSDMLFSHALPSWFISNTCIYIDRLLVKDKKQF